MTAISLLAAALLAQSATPMTVSAPALERIDVGYVELSQGKPEAAIARIRANREIEAGDPAALINLGAAHARLGRHSEARGFLRAAILTPERYDLQLADGRWMNSRAAARLAIAMQAQGQTLAVK